MEVNEIILLNEDRSPLSTGLQILIEENSISVECSQRNSPSEKADLSKTDLSPRYIENKKREKIQII